MKKSFLHEAVIVFFAIVFFVFPSLPASAEPVSLEAVYLGVKDYGNVERADVLNPEARVYRFWADGEERLFSIDCGEIYPSEATEAERAEDTKYMGVLPAEFGGYPIQNMLQEKERYLISVENSQIVDCKPLFEHKATASVISGTPGKRTVKNFLQTALMPVGRTLYVFGGGWDWQDMGFSDVSRTIGLLGEWEKFFGSQDANYSYKNPDDKSHTPYPFGGWNQYYYQGLDCSAYVSWTLYNTFFGKSLVYPGLGGNSRAIRDNLAKKYKLGKGEHFLGKLYPGDIVSISGHVWICVGVCNDGSIVILHSSPTVSRAGAAGGGVQLTALSAKGERDTQCEAYKLVSHYMEQYYPQWSLRYSAAVKDTKVYLDFPDDKPTVGVFHWNVTDKALQTSGMELIGLADPEGLRGMSANEVLAVIFNEKVE